MIKRAIRWTKWLTAGLVVLIMVLTLSIAALLFTGPGLNVIVWGAQQALPQLIIASSQGALLPRFTLSDVRFNDPGLNIDARVDHLTLAMQASCLLDPVLCINEVAVDGLKLSLPQLPPASEETTPESEPVTHIATPVPIRIGRLSLNNIDLDVLGNQIRWQQFSTRAQFQSNRLTIGRTEWQGIDVTLAQTADEPVNTSAAAEDQAREDITLPEVIIPLRVELNRFDVRDFTLHQATPLIINHLGLQAEAYRSQVNVTTLELDMPQVKARLDAKATLQGDYPLALNLESTLLLDEAKGQTLHLQASGSAADLKLQAELGERARAQIEASLQPLKADLPFTASIRDLAAQWPLVGQGQYRVQAPRIEAHGSLQGYQFDVQSQLQGQGMPDTTLSLTGNGDLHQVSLDALKMATLGGEIAGQATANWDAPVNWQASLRLDNIQPGLQWPEAQGVINGELTTSGQLTAQGGWRAELPLLAIKGDIAGYPLDINGSLRAADASGKGEFKASTPGLTVAHGANRIVAKGELDQRWRMGVSINLPDLSKSIPDLKGKVIGDVLLRGALQQPDIKLALDGDKLAWQQMATIGHLTLSGNVTPLPQPKADLTLQVSDIDVEQQHIRSARLVASGSQAEHQLTLDVDSDVAATSLAIRGSLQQDPQMVWNGELQRMWIESQQGRWRLNQATAVKANIDTQRATIAAHCWQQAGASLCLDKPAEVGEKGNAQVSLTGFEFEQIKDLLPEATKIKGALDANAKVSWAPNKAPQVDASLRMPAGYVEQQAGETLHLGWDQVAVNAKLQGNQLQADWQLDVTDNGDISGKLSIGDVTSQEREMNGELTLTRFNLDFLAPLIGEYSQVQSTLQSQLTFNGPLLHPKVYGNFGVSDILVRGDISPVEVQSGDVSIDFKGYQADLNAAIQTPDGRLDIKGDADWEQMQDWRVNAHVGAESLTVDMPPMVKMKVVPDLNLAMQPQLAQISGHIALPWGRIVVEELPPSAIGVSKDQVLVDENQQPISDETAVPFNVETNVSISIGDDFKLSAFGLEAGLVGQLNVSQKDQGPFVTGEVNITDGQYRSFGQDLIIQEGKILMNGPVDQPYLSIKAIRNPDNTQDDVTAGVQVTGPADEPNVSIFSDPAMPQANALSYLLRGQDIDSETGGNAMTTTLIGLSLAKSGKVVGQLGEELGVQNLQLDTAGSGDDSQVTVSGYILPGLQVKYGVGIFNSVGEFTVRYRLLKDLYLEAVSGLDSAVDILYRFEFD